MAKSGKFMRRHHSLALNISEKEQAKMEAHYAAHGIHVTHRKAPIGGLEPVFGSSEDFQKCLKARGLVDYSR